MVSLPPDDLNARPLIDDEPDEPQVDESYASQQLAAKMPLYSSLTDPSWLEVAKYLLKMQEQATEALISCQVPSLVASYQGQIKTLRHLLELPRQLGNEIRSLQQVMEGD